MRAVEISEYGEPGVLRLNPHAPDPVPADDEVLIRIHATAVNLVDAARRAGYGRHLFDRGGRARMPLILGHDASGVVAAVGAKVTRFAVGDEVWSAPDAFRNGTYAELVAVREREVARKPRNLTHPQAAALPYVALTAWSALVRGKAVVPGQAQDVKVLVHAGSGGVGSFAIQLLKAWGATVATTCSTANVALCRSLGADVVIDYTCQDYAKELSNYDVVLDTLGYLEDAEGPSLSTLKRGRGAVYISLVNPMLPMIDRLGLAPGLLAAFGILLGRKVWQGLVHDRRYVWAHFTPDGAALEVIRDLVENGQIRPIVQSVLPLEDVVTAHELIATRRVRGKLVLEVIPS